MKKFENTQDQVFHSQGLYYTFRPSDKFNNTLMAFSALQAAYSYLNFPEEDAPEYAKDIKVTSRPNIFGLRNKSQFGWWDGHSEVKTGIEYTLYAFSAHGKTYVQRKQSEIVDLSDEDLYLAYDVDEKINNHLLGGYIENKFMFGGFTAVPGIRSDYLKRTKCASVDPRITISY